MTNRGDTVYGPATGRHVKIMNIADCYVEEGVVHYCVPNIPSACARTATLALTQATLPYVMRLAKRGLDAMSGDPGFAAGLQAHEGRVTHQGLAEDTGRPFVAHTL